MKPLVKWVGGKTRLLPVLREVLPDVPIYEPFAGGAALLFDRIGTHSNTLVSDLCEPLIDMYTAVRDDVALVTEALYELEAGEAWPETYYDNRARFNELRIQYAGGRSHVEQSALFLWLNRAGFNGMYRENRKGQFNIPKGSYKTLALPDWQRLREVSDAIQAVGFAHGTFASVDFSRFQSVKAVYADPPYWPAPKGEAVPRGFTRYNREGFTEADQAALAYSCRTWAAAGYPVYVSNHDVEPVHTLYTEYGGERVWSGLVNRTNGVGNRKPVNEGIWRFGKAP